MLSLIALHIKNWFWDGISGVEAVLSFTDLKVVIYREMSKDSKWGGCQEWEDQIQKVELDPSAHYVMDYKAYKDLELEDKINLQVS